MRISAALCWFDEPNELLRGCIASLAPFVDHLVAVDGAWSLWENAEPQSSFSQVGAIAGSCGRHGISHQSITPGRLWETQVEKRSAAIAAAAERADWVMPIDADWTFSGDPERFRSQLLEAQGDSGTMAFYTPPPAEGANLDVYHPWHREIAGRTLIQPFIYRALDEIRCEGRHWFYSGMKAGERVALQDGFAGYPAAERFHVDALTITHHCFSRDEARSDANRRYVNERSELMAAGAVGEP